MRFVLFGAVRQTEGYCSGHKEWLGYEEQTEKGMQVTRLPVQGKDLILHEYGACKTAEPSPNLGSREIHVSNGQTSLIEGGN